MAASVAVVGSMNMDLVVQTPHLPKPGETVIGDAYVQATSPLRRYLDLVVGDGAEAVAGQTVTVHYAGWILDGEKFDASVDRGETFSFPLGAGQVIPGWDEGVAGMRVGGHRRLVIPPELGYGDGGYPPVIPPEATLVFDVQLFGVGSGI